MTGFDRHEQALAALQRVCEVHAVSDRQRERCLRRCDQHQRVGKKRVARGGIDQRLARDIVHPLFISRDEDVGACALLDLPRQRRAAGEAELRLGMALGDIEIADGVQHVCEAGRCEHDSWLLDRRRRRFDGLALAARHQDKGSGQRSRRVHHRFHVSIPYRA